MYAYTYIHIYIYRYIYTYMYTYVYIHIARPEMSDLTALTYSFKTFPKSKRSPVSILSCAWSAIHVECAYDFSSPRVQRSLIKTFAMCMILVCGFMFTLENTSQSASVRYSSTRSKVCFLVEADPGPPSCTLSSTAIFKACLSSSGSWLLCIFSCITRASSKIAHMIIYIYSHTDIHADIYIYIYTYIYIYLYI